MSAPRRTSSSMRFAAVNTAIDSVLLKMKMRLEDRQKQGRLDISDAEIDTIARLARGLSYDSCVDSYDQGRRDGRLRARLELGEPADEANIIGSEIWTLCPTCKRVVG